MSRPDADGQPEELNFEQELAEVERSLHELKQRHLQVQQDQVTQAQLQQRQQQLKQNSSANHTELKRIQAQLEELEINLESRLFTWGSLKEAFWQVVRFGGLGIAIGWFLAFAVLQSPKPSPPTPNTPQQPQP